MLWPTGGATSPNYCVSDCSCRLYRVEMRRGRKGNAPGRTEWGAVAVGRYFDDGFSFREYEAGGEMEAA